MSATHPPLTDDAIYFASIPVFFTPVPGETIPFIASEWHEDASSLPAALARFSLIPDPDGGLPLFHPAIPALDLLRKSDASSESARAAAAQALPLLLRQPLLKVPESLSPPPPNTIQGYASGVRSALLKLDGHWSASSHLLPPYQHQAIAFLQFLLSNQFTPRPSQVSPQRLRQQQRRLHRQKRAPKHLCRRRCPANARISPSARRGLPPHRSSRASHVWSCCRRSGSSGRCRRKHSRCLHDVCITAVTLIQCSQSLASSRCFSQIHVSCAAAVRPISTRTHLPPI